MITEIFENDVIISFGSSALIFSLSQPVTNPLIRDCYVLVLDEGQLSSKRNHIFVQTYWVSRHGSVSIGKSRLLLDPIENSKILDTKSWPHVVKFAELKGIAVTFLGNRRYYRSLLDNAGRDVARRMLLRANDIGALQAFHPKSSALRQFRASRAFSQIISTDEEQFAFLSLNSLFTETARGLPPDIAEIQANVQISKGKTLQLNLKFPEVLRVVQPLTAIIGPNGSGKTRLLLALCKTVFRSKTDIPQVKALFPDSPSGVLRKPRVVVFTYEKHLWAAPRRAGARIMSLGVERTNWRSLGLNLQRLATSENSEFNLAAFCRVIQEVIDVNDMRLPQIAPSKETEASIQSIPFLDLVEQAGDKKIVTSIDPGSDVFFFSEKKGLYSISSGQKSVLIFIAHLYVEAAQGALVLIDEPENHLHPRFVSIMMQALMRALLATQSRAVVVTHSPFVVREVDKSAVLIINPDAEGTPTLYRTTLQTFGADVTAISDHAFLDSEVRKAYEVRIDEMLISASSELERNDVIREVASHVGRDAELYLRLKETGRT